MTEDVNRSYNKWAVVELFGHRVVAGFVSAEYIGDQSFVKVQVPETSLSPAWEKSYGKNAIYAITPCSEEDAKRACLHWNASPFEDFSIGLGDETVPAIFTHSTDDFGGDIDRGPDLGRGWGRV